MGKSPNAMLFLSSCPSSKQPSGCPPHIWRGVLVTPWNESFCPCGKNWDLSSQFLLTFQQQTEYLVVNLSSVSQNSQMFNLCFYSSSKVNRIQAAASCNYQDHRSRASMAVWVPSVWKQLSVLQCRTAAAGRKWEHSSVGTLAAMVSAGLPLLNCVCRHLIQLYFLHVKKSQTHPWTPINTELFLVFFVFL